MRAFKRLTHQRRYPVELQSELEKLALELMMLIQRINRTNAGSRFDTGTLGDHLQNETF
jgi:hypothetical protein